MLGRPAGESRGTDREEVLRFLRDTVAPALTEVGDELARGGRSADVDVRPEQVSITLYDGDDEAFYYAVRARRYRRATFAYPELSFEDDGRDVYWRAEVYLREGSQGYGIFGYDRQQVIANFLHEYDKRLRWQKPSTPRT